MFKLEILIVDKHLVKKCLKKKLGEMSMRGISVRASVSINTIFTSFILGMKMRGSASESARLVFFKILNPQCFQIQLLFLKKINK